MKKAKEWSLQLFAEDSTAQAQQGETGEVTDDTAVAAAQPIQNPEDNASGNAEEMSADERFRQLIKGEYKEQYAAETQRLINQRFKQQKELEAQVEALTGRQNRLNSVLGVKYGIDASDSDAILAAVEADEDVYAEAAYKAGMNVDTFKEHLKGQEALRQIQEQSRRERRTQLIGAFNRQADEVKTKFGDTSFDWQNEYAGNPRFKNFIDSGASIEEAYVALNFARINEQAAAKAAEQARAAVTNDIIANGRRPVEGSVINQTRVQSTVSPLSYSDAQIDEMMEKVRRGEKVPL